MQLVIHAGVYRTGTTSLRFLAENRAAREAVLSCLSASQMIKPRTAAIGAWKMALTSFAGEANASSAWKDVPPSFREEVLAWAARHKGKLYAPITHPQLADIPSVWPPRRFETVRAAVPADARTALDIGAHWGFFSLGLAKLGLEVTAVESDPENAGFLRRIAEVSGIRVTVEERSIFDLDRVEFDLVLALNIFHHFLRKPETYGKLIEFLSRLRCRTMIYQAHSVDGPKMKEAFARIPPEEMCDIICRKTKLSNWEMIDIFNKRKVFRIY